MAQSMATTCHIYIGLKFLQATGLDPMTSRQGKRLGKGHRPARQRMCLIIYMAHIIFQLNCIVCWGADQVGA
jgi:hypothetical protein